jgi:hypothetical protein
VKRPKQGGALNASRRPPRRSVWRSSGQRGCGPRSGRGRPNGRAGDDPDRGERDGAAPRRGATGTVRIRRAAGGSRPCPWGPTLTRAASGGTTRLLAKVAIAATPGMSVSEDKVLEHRAEDGSRSAWQCRASSAGRGTDANPARPVGHRGRTALETLVPPVRPMGRLAPAHPGRGGADAGDGIQQRNSRGGYRCPADALAEGYRCAGVSRETAAPPTEPPRGLADAAGLAYRMRPPISPGWRFAARTSVLRHSP